MLASALSGTTDEMCELVKTCKSFLGKHVTFLLDCLLLGVSQYSMLSCICLQRNHNVQWLDVAVTLDGISYGEILARENLADYTPSDLGL